jgi:hypothetical protein
MDADFYELQPGLYGPYLYVLDGHEPVPAKSLGEHAIFMSDPRNVVVAQDDLGGVWVSTVFLGFDLGRFRGRPCFYETMVFGGRYDLSQDRYSSWDEAEAGHREWCERVSISNVKGGES